MGVDHRRGNRWVWITGGATGGCGSQEGQQVGEDHGRGNRWAWIMGGATGGCGSQEG